MIVDFYASLFFTLFLIFFRLLTDENGFWWGLFDMFADFFIFFLIIILVSVWETLF